MIVYTGHPEYDFVYECRVRGPYLGCFVGISRHAYGEFVLPENMTPQLKPLLDSLTPRESTGLGIDGEGVFHGIPKPRVFVEATKDAADVFGEYPKNLVRPRKIGPISRNIKTRQECELELFRLLNIISDERRYITGSQLIDSIRTGVRSFIDRYFKEVP